MTIVLGFGSTETAFEESERAAFEQFVAELFRESGEMYFTAETISKAAKWLDKRGHEYRVKSDEHKLSPTFPERYSYYYPHVLGDASYVVAVMNFSHINRRHPMSPDGWALLSTKRCFSVSGSDLDSLKEAA